MPNSTWDVSCGDDTLGWQADLPPQVGWPLFIEMAQFYSDGRKEEWREAARWVKYEEDIEDSMRWSKPYVPTIQLSSLYELRRALETAEVQLQFNCNSEEKACRILVDTWATQGVIQESERAKVLQTLLRPHIHLYETSASIIPTLFRKKKPALERKTSSGAAEFLRRNSISSVVYRQPTKGDNEKNVQFLRKIPANAECANILVGEVGGLKQSICAFLRLKDATKLGNMTEVPLPTRFVFILLSPAGKDVTEIGRAVGTLLTDPGFKEIAYKAESKDKLLGGIDKFLDSTSILPPATWDCSIRLEPPAVGAGGHGHGSSHDGEEKDNGLQRTGRLFGGFINDVKRKAPFYLSDFKDALSLQVLATWMFLYFACLTPMITFGGMMGSATDNQMGVMETMVAGCVCGIVYALLSGQPLTILGSTGPILVALAGSYGLNYMEFRLWVGLWIALILLILVATDASSLVSYITRFTEDNFATLVACIFMIEAIKKVMAIAAPQTPAGVSLTNLSEETFSHIFELNDTSTLSPLAPLDPDERQSVFLMSLLLFIGTFFIAYMLKEFRASPFFPTLVRYIVSDFSVILAILCMTLVDYKAGIPTPKLIVPTEFAPTSDKRNWLIQPFGHNNFISIFAAAIPAVLATILIFMDQQITAVIVNRKDHKLKKGCGYHLDLFVLALLIILGSFFGLPWFVAATVESLTNVGSLKMESESAAPGEKPTFLGVREQRLSNILVFSTVGVSVLITGALVHVPMPVLYGVFLYMGFSALMRMELFQRILLFFMPLKYQPDSAYLRVVPLRRVHLFTLIQVFCLALLWIIKIIPVTAILFPLMLVVMMVVRKLLDFVFTQTELKALDDILPGRKEEKRDSKLIKRLDGSVEVNGITYKTVATDDV